MKYFRYWLSVLTIFYSITAYSLDVGDDAPKLDIVRWMKGRRIMLYPKTPQSNDGINYYVIFFWATWSNSSSRLLEFVEKEYQLYKESGVVFLGISKESPTRVKNFLDKFSDINYSLAIDEQAKTYDEYMGGTKGVPMFFVFDKEKELLWKGSPFELDRVLSRTVSDTFDIEKQNKIENLREEIRSASQFLDSEKKLKAAKKTLEIDPTDEVAINIIIDNYIRKNELSEAVEFLKNTMKKTQGNIFLQQNLVLLELSIIRGMDVVSSKAILLDLARNCYSQFYNNPKILSNISSTILQSMPFEIRPLNELLKMAIRCVAIEKRSAKNPEMLGIYYQTLARTYYSLGCFSKALDAQSKAVALIKNDTEKQEARIKEEYYKEALSQYKDDQDNKDDILLESSDSIEKTDRGNIDYIRNLKEKDLLQARLYDMQELLEKERKENQSVIDSLKNKSTTLVSKKDYNKLLQEKTELSGSNKKLLEKIELLSTLSGPSDSLKALEGKLSNTQTELERIIRENKLLQQSNADLQNRNNSLEKNIKDSSEVNNDTQSQILKYQNEIVDLNKTINELKSERKTLKSYQKKSSADIKKGYIEKVNELEIALAKTRDDNDLLNKKNKILEEKVKNVEGQNDNMRGQTPAYSLDLDKKIEKLQLDMLVIEQAKDALELKVKELNYKNEKLTDQNKLLSYAANDAGGDDGSKSNSQKVYMLKRALDQEKKKNEIISKKLQVLQNNRRESSNQDVNFKNNLASIKEQMQKLEQSKSKIELEKEQLELKNKSLSEELKVLSQQSGNSRERDLALENEQLKEKLQSLQKELDFDLFNSGSNGVRKDSSMGSSDASYEIKKLKRQLELSQSNILRLQSYNDTIQQELNDAKNKVITLTQNNNRDSSHDSNNINDTEPKPVVSENDFKLNQALKEKEDYKAKLEVVTAELDNIDKEMNALKDENNILNQKIQKSSSVESKNNSLASVELLKTKKDLVAALDNNSNLMSEITISEKLNNDLRSKVKDLSNKLKEKDLLDNSNLKAMEEKLNAELIKNAGYKEKLDTVTQNFKVLENKNVDLSNRINELNKEINEKSVSGTERLTEVKKELNRALQNSLKYEDELIAAKSTIDNLNAKNVVLVDENKLLNQKLEEFIAGNKRSTNVEGDVKNNELELALLDNLTYKNKLKISDKKADRLNLENSSLKDEVHELKERLSELAVDGGIGNSSSSQSLTRILDDNKSLKNRIDLLNKQLSELKQENNNLNDKVKRLSQNGFHDLSDSVDYDNLQKELEELKKENFRLREKQSDMGQSLLSGFESNEEFSQLKNDLDAALQENLSNVAKLDRYEKNNLELKKENSELGNRVNELISKLQDKVSIADDKYLDVQKELDLALQDNLSYKARIEKIEDELDGVSAQNLKLKNDKIVLNKEINELMTRAKEAQSDAGNKYSSVKEKLDLALQDNLSLEKKIRLLDSDFDSVKQENDKLSKENNTLGQKVDELNTRFEKQQSTTASELSRVSKELDQAVQENLSVESKLESLNRRVEELSQENNKLNSEKNTYSRNVREIAQRLKTEHYERVRLTENLEAAKLQYDISISAMQKENSELKKKLSGYQQVIKSISELNQ